MFAPICSFSEITSLVRVARWLLPKSRQGICVMHDYFIQWPNV